MGVDFPYLVYDPCFNVFSRIITFYPVVSQPGVPSFTARGIYDTNEIDVVAMDGSILSDARTELDVLMPEWSVLPMQGDVVDIPVADDIDGGVFWVADAMGHGNAGGELTLVLKRFEQAKLPGYLLITPGLTLGALDLAKPLMQFKEIFHMIIGNYSLSSPNFATPVLG